MPVTTPDGERMLGQTANRLSGLRIEGRGKPTPNLERNAGEGVLRDPGTVVMIEASPLGHAIKSMAVNPLRRLDRLPVSAKGDSLAGCSLRLAIRFLGEPLAKAYEEAVLGTMQGDGNPDPRYADLLRFALAAQETPGAITPAVVTFLEPHFDAVEIRALIAFAGAAQLYPAALKSA